MTVSETISYTTKVENITKSQLELDIIIDKLVQIREGLRVGYELGVTIKSIS